MDKKKLDSTLLLESRTSNKFCEFLAKSKIKVDEYKTEDLLLKALNKKLPTYIFVDHKKLSQKFIDFIKDKNPSQLIVFIKLDNETEEFLSIYKEQLPQAVTKVINKTTNYDAFEQVLLEIELAKCSVSDSTTQDNNESNEILEKNRRYRYIKLLGSGQEGVVNLLEDLVEKKLIAMKTLKMTDLNELTKTTMREKEELTESLKCPTMIEFLGSTEDKSNKYISMEYAVGGTLNDYMRTLRLTGEELTPDQILNWFVQILIALKVLHDNKISHRDIKPENILLCQNPKVLDTKDKKLMIAKISDLGISKIIEGEGKHTVIGTLHYVAPEVISDMDYSASVDIWSLAVLLYEIALRKKPFDELEERFLREAIKNNNVQDELPQNLDFRIKYLLMNLLKKDPKMRLSIIEIFSLDFIQDKVKSLLDVFPEWKDKFPVFKEILAIDIVPCPFEPTFFCEENSKLINLCFKMMENVSPKPFKKSFLGGTIENTYQGSDIYTFIGDELPEKMVDPTIELLLKNKILVNLSKNNSNETEVNSDDYYIVSFYNTQSNIDNPSFGNLKPVKPQNNLMCLIEHVMGLAEDLKQDVVDEDKVLDLSDPRLIEFLFGISLFNNFSLLEKNSFESKDHRHAFLLNLYQIMFLHNLVKEKLVLKKKKNLLSFIKNDIAITYQFKDVSYNNLEIRHGLFRGNQKPLENYLRICNANDKKLDIMKDIKVKVVDLLIVNELIPLEEFSFDAYLTRFFFGKNLETQLLQYLVDFSNTCFEIIDDQFRIAPVYFKYFELDLNGAKGLLSALNSALNYNETVTYCILKLQNVDVNKASELKNVNKLCNEIKNGRRKIVFE